MSSKTEPLVWTPTLPAQDRMDLTTAMRPPTSTSLPSIPPTGASPSSSPPPPPPPRSRPRPPPPSSTSAASPSHDHPAPSSMPSTSIPSTSIPSLNPLAATKLISTSHIQPTVEFRFTNPHKPAVIGSAGGDAGGGSTAASSAPSALERGRTHLIPLIPPSTSHGSNSDRFKPDNFINQFRLGASGGVVGSAAMTATLVNSANSNPTAPTPRHGTGPGTDSKGSLWSPASTKTNTTRQTSLISSPSSTRVANPNPSLPVPTDGRDVTARSASPLAPSNFRPPPTASPSVPEKKEQAENNSSHKSPLAPSKPNKQVADNRTSPSGAVQGPAPSRSGTNGTGSQKPGASHRGLERSKDEPKAKKIKTSGGTGSGSGVAAESGRAAHSTTAQDNPLALQAGVMHSLSTQMYNENIEYKRRLEHTERKVRALEGEKQELKQTFRAKVETALDKYGGAGLAMAQTQKNLQDVAARLHREIDPRELGQLRREIQDSLGTLQRDYTNPSGSLTLERIESTKLDVIRQQQQELKNRDDVISLLREKLEMNTGLLAEANVQRSALETQVGKIEGQVTHLQGVVQEQARQGEADRTKHCREVQQRDSIIAAAASEKGNLVTEFESLKTRHDAVTRQKEEMAQLLVEKEDERKRLTSELQIERAELDRLRSLNERQERELETLRPLREAVEEAKAELARHRSQSGQTIDDLRTELSKLEHQYHAKEEELHSEATTNAKHVERITALEGTVSNLEATNQTAALQVVDLNNTLEASHQQLLALQTDLQRQRDANLSDQLELAASRENELKLEHELGQVKKECDEASERCATLVMRQQERERQTVEEVMALMERELAKKDHELAIKEGELKRAQNRIGVEERAKQKALLQIAKLKQRPVIENDIGSSPNGSAVREQEGSGGEEGRKIGDQEHDDSPTPNTIKPPATVPVRVQQRGGARRVTPATTTTISSTGKRSSAAGSSSGGNRS